MYNVGSIVGHVVDVDVKKDGSVYVIAEHKGNVIGANDYHQHLQKNIKEKESFNQQSIGYKVIKASPKAISGVVAHEEHSALIGGPHHRLVSSERFGNFIVGETTFTAHPEQIRIGGAYRINGLHTSTMASTIVTPLPLLQFDYPLESAIDNIVSITKEFQQYMSEVL